MGFDNIKKKGEAMGKKPMAQTLKVNKYEDPQMALNLIAHICTAANSLNISACFEKHDKLIDKLKDEIIDKNYTLQNKSFINDLLFCEWNLEDELVNTLSSSLKIAVAGGFSAGKSSLLNSLTKIGNLLPTGVEPVSVVNTYLNCRANTPLIIKGKNLKDEIVLLNDEVLACIQHSSKSKTYVAPVLKRIIIDTPAEAYLNKITFVDTPGYNNSLNTSDSDRKTAEDAMRDCDAIFWCIDIESGTITKKDLDMIKPYKEKPIVIFYTKMDKKSDNDVKRIVEDTEKTCLREFGRENMPITIMAVSCVNKKKYSTAHLTFQQVIEFIKRRCGSADLLKRYQQKISNMFDEEIEASNEAITNYEEQRKEQIKDKNEWYEIYRNNKDYTNNMKEKLKDVILDSYDDIMEAADKRNEYLSEAIDGWCEALNREVDWESKVGFFSDASSLSNQHSRAVDEYQRLCNKDASYTYWKRKDRDYWYKEVCERYDNLIEETKTHIDDSENAYQRIVENKKNEEEFRKLLVQYKPQVLQALEEAYNKCMKQIQILQSHLQTLEKTEKSDVFSAISGDNYERFLSCFSDGVDLRVCNQEGYSPVTWAVRSGNNEMVKFFINHDTDLSMKDKRGYNTLETAAMCHYQDMCELLMEADHSLINESQSLTKLAAMNNFTNWVARFK